MTHVVTSNCKGCRFTDCQLTGTFNPTDGNSFWHCYFLNGVTGLQGDLHQCGFTGIVSIGVGGTCTIIDGYSLVPGLSRLRTTLIGEVQPQRPGCRQGQPHQSPPGGRAGLGRAGDGQLHRHHRRRLSRLLLLVGCAVRSGICDGGL